MRLILSRKGFDSQAGGCPSPIFPDGSILSLPIPDKKASVRYRDLNWRGHNLGDLVSTLRRARPRPDHFVHLDPDLRRDLCARHPGWRPAFGQGGSAQGHLRRQGVGVGDLFLFFGLFQEVDDRLNWRGSPEHHIWGWMQVDVVAPVDQVVRRGGAPWAWAQAHPHLAAAPDAANTLYVAADRLQLPGVRLPRIPGAGAFQTRDDRRRLTRPGGAGTTDWALPPGFLPKGRPPLTYHGRPERWTPARGHVRLRAVAKGQEFVLDLQLYPELVGWLAQLFTNSRL